MKKGSGNEPTWLTRLNAQLAFGPRPKTPEDIKYVVKTLELNCIMNASPHDVKDRVRYEKDYEDAYKFYVVDARLQPTTDLDSSETLLHAIRKLVDIRNLTKHNRIYVHAESGLMDEAYIGLTLWRLFWPEETPQNLEAWLVEHHKEALFGDDEEKRALMLGVWSLLGAEDETRRKKSVFGVIMKRAKK